MTRMESIRRQYESVPEARQVLPPKRCGNVRPRSKFWLWFWFLFLATLFIGFFGFKSTILPWCKDKLSNNQSDKTLTIPGGVAADGDLNTHQGAKESSISVEEFIAYTMPSESEMVQLFEYVRNSSHVKDNLLYAETMNASRFFYNKTNNTVNAFAGVRKLNEKDDSLTRVLCVLGGAARFSRVASLAVAAEMNGDKGAGSRFLKALKPQDCSILDAAAAQRIVKEAGLSAVLSDVATLSKAKSISAGLLLGIIAHECGHLSLGHVLKTSDTVNLEISRNQEREADSFASSVIASSPFGEYVLVGTLFWHYALAHRQDGASATTHPLSKERFENFVRANPSIAASLGIVL